MKFKIRNFYLPFLIAHIFQGIVCILLSVYLKIYITYDIFGLASIFPVGVGIYFCDVVIKDEEVFVEYEKM